MDGLRGGRGTGRHRARRVPARVSLRTSWRSGGALCVLAALVLVGALVAAGVVAGSRPAQAEGGGGHGGDGGPVGASTSTGGSGGGSGSGALLPVLPPGGVLGGVQTRVVGGERASTTDHPWVAYLTDPSGFQFCGGTLVAPTKVITAAHCMGSVAPTSIRVVTGRDDKDSQAGEVTAVKSAWVSPDFNGVGQGLDVAILTLARPSTRATLPLADASDTAFYRSGTAARVYGWGTTSEGGTASRYLGAATVPMRDDAYCRAGDSGYDPSLLTCAGYDSGGVDTCQGDSGGPLVIAGKLAGITSFGDGCARPGKPGYYVRVGAVSARLAPELR